MPVRTINLGGVVAQSQPKISPGSTEDGAAYNNQLYVVFTSAEKTYGVPTEMVREMFPVPRVSRVPNSPAHMRGVINLRGRVIPLYDLRTRLGGRSVAQENEDMARMMRDREEDHRLWVAELEACVRESREFTLGRDPHKCAFGKWYDNYQTEDMRLSELLRRFDPPHQKIHGVAGQVLEMAANGDKEGALAVLDEIRGGALAAMLILFEEVRKVIRVARQEIALVLEEWGRYVALCVDGVEAVEALQPDSTAEMPTLSKRGRDRLNARLGRRASGGGLVVLLDPSEFLAAGQTTG